MSFRIGVDVGGTFTDVLLLDDDTGAFQIAKTLTTPEDPSIGVLHAIVQAVVAAGIHAEAVRNVIHGTTLVTNAIIQRTGARTALLTTRGFRDVLDIAHEHRYDMYDLLLEQPRPLVARQDRFEVDERLFADGTIHRPVDLATVDDALGEIERRGINTVAIVFLHAFRNPQHEKAVAERIASRSPHLRVSLSSEVAGEIREYERTSTTVANAYVQELVDRYVDRLADELREIRVAGRLFLMLSNGGIATAETAARFPVRLIESGPAAGALAASHLGRQSGRPDLLSFDMGGTTAKACLIENGKPFTANQFEVDRVYRFKPGSGLPIEAPAIDLIEIGAGGGSIARIDRFGLIKVGPESAGAAPGPACYGLGGDQPTVTDADLVLGYLDPAFFLGGQLKLDRAAAENAIRREVAARIGKSVTEAAWAIYQTANENMASAARMHAVERGKDIRQYPLFAFGGAGPVHAYHVASILRLRQIIAPFAAGVGSTIGFLAAPLALDFVRGAAGLLESLDWAEIDRLYSEMEKEGRALLTAAEMPANEVTLVRTAEMRLAGQAHQISVPIPEGDLSSENLIEIRHSFDEVYLGLFKRAAPGVPIEALNWRLSVSGPHPEVRPLCSQGGREARDALKGERPIYLPRRGEFVTVPVYDRNRLAAGARFFGPAVVEERESTVVVGGHARVEVDNWSNLVIDLGEE